MQYAPDKTDLNFAPQLVSATNQYSARNMAKPVNFICVAANATQVFLVGDFNDWNPGSHPMKRQPDGAWLNWSPLTGLQAF